MNTHLLILEYPDNDSEIKTIYENNEVFFCLPDVVTLLVQQNVNLANENEPDNIIGLLNALIQVLDADEIKNVDNVPYVTQPGLFRIILRDNSRACKKFQRWVLHDVLPSIQKYGTYPAPLIEQDSDIKRVVKSLLAEIEQREKLEEETREQFQIHQRRLDHLSERIESMSSETLSGKFISIIDYCEENGINPNKIQLIFGWCIKIVSERNEPTTKAFIDGKEEKLFPPHVIHEAIQATTS